MPALFLSPYLLPILLLLGSNVFMTTAWYWHLRFKEVPLWQVILISWGFAFFEYVWLYRPTVTVAPSIRQLNSRPSRR